MLRISDKCTLGCGLALALLTPVSQAHAKSSETVLYAFQGGSDGTKPYYGDLIADSSGNLYGTTDRGGTNGDGTVFKLAPDGTESVLHTFQGGSDGAYPYAGLIADSSGNLYGTTAGGGADGDGTVFKLATDGTETVLRSFAGGSDGANPDAGLIVDKKGDVYGTTYYGGGNGCYMGYGCGTVFEVTPGGTETVLYVFAGGNDGENPWAGLLADSSGNLYGTTLYGGADGDGTVFKLTPGGIESVLYAFQGGSDGETPYDGLLADSSGNFYGTTVYGGADGDGTVFKLTPDGNESVLYAFQGGSDGENPYDGLIMDKKGNFYGTTRQGGSARCAGSGCGTVFALAPDGTESVLYAFKGTHGVHPCAGLLADKAGNLYGTTSRGGDRHRGTVFKIAN